MSVNNRSSSGDAKITLIIYTRPSKWLALLCGSKPPILSRIVESFHVERSVRFNFKSSTLNRESARINA